MGLEDHRREDLDPVRSKLPVTRDPRLARLRVGAQPSCDPLTRAVMDRMLAGVSTRKFAGVGEPVGTTVEDSASATSKSTVSEQFVERTRTALGELMGRRLDDVRLAGSTV